MPQIPSYLQINPTIKHTITQVIKFFCVFDVLLHLNNYAITSFVLRNGLFSANKKEFLREILTLK